MFVDDHSFLHGSLARALLSAERRVAAFNVEVRYALDQDGLHVVGAQTAASRLVTDPPLVAGRSAWLGCSITAHGVVRGDGRETSRRVTLTTSAHPTSLRIFGERRWRRKDGPVIASAPAPITEVPLSWAHAFGGTPSEAPGLAPDGFPTPGGPVPHPSNPLGQGFYLSEAAADGEPLAAIEFEGAPQQSWEGLDRPAGIAPCPTLNALRLRVPSTERNTPDSSTTTHQCLRLFHHAPDALIFDRVDPGTLISLEGVGDTLTLQVPESPARVWLRAGSSETELAASLRSLHLDAERREAVLSFGHMFFYGPTHSNAWLRVIGR